jgi:tetratricopeptide (TPR) repeat protein/ADP-heptose:LPS heptosyltransferase
VSGSFAAPTEPQDALHRGLAAHQAGQLAEAVRLYESVLSVAPAQFDALHLLGVVAAQQGRHEEACRLIGRALAINAGSATAFCNYALALNALGRFDEALESCNNALALHPGYGYAHNCRAATLQAVCRYEEALVAADLALLHQPDELEALNRRGNALHSMGRHEEALVSYDRALTLQPDSVESLNNRATALHSLNRFEEAIASCDRALAARPDYLEALHNRGNALRDLGRHQEALASYARALAFHPNYAEAHCGQGFVYLALGDLARGFSEYEWRWRVSTPTMTPRNFSQPLWRGDADLIGKTILLHAEQGFGDTLQFCRYVPMVAARGARIVLEVQPLLKPLLRSGIGQVFASGERLPDFDLHCPLLSLPLAFDTRLETVPASIPYIAVPQKRAAAWAPRLGRPGRPRVGIAWAGYAGHGNNRNRSIGLEPLLALAASGINLISLQKEVSAQDRELLGAHGEILRLGEEFTDFADTAAVIAELDLVISVDTAVAHLAGAMGKPVFILLPYAPDWRWLLERADSPWYPTARLFRQKRAGDWDSVIAEVRVALGEKFSLAATHLSSADAAFSDALALWEAGKFEATLESTDRALALRPDFVEALHCRALALRALNRLEEALASFDRALALRPDYYEALNNRAVVLRALHRDEEALPSYDRALTLRPDNAEAAYNRGNLLRHLGRREEALASYDRALASRPDFIDALYNRGNVLCQLKRFGEALATYDRALALQPDPGESVEVLINRANALHALSRLDEAVASYDRVLALKPDYVEAHSNRGYALYQLNRHDEAMASYAKALALRPDHASAHWNESLSHLVCGDFERGWRAYEWRWKMPAMPPRDFSQPLLKGDADLAGKTVLLHAEQGLGDTIQFCRYVPMVAARNARVVLEVQPPLKRLLGSLAGVAQIFAQGEPLADFDLHCPLLSLPLAFDTRLETVPAAIPYIAAPADRAALWASRLGPRVGPRVGIAWAGSAKHGDDRNRSIGLAPLLVLAASGVSLISLQKEMNAQDRELLGSRGDILRLGEEFTDFADTAAVIAELDLVISVDTAVAHLAGAMGKPVFILLPYAPDWRWLLERADSPWYPTARLFRQKRPGDWGAVVASVVAALGEMFSAATAELSSTTLDLSSSNLGSADAAFSAAVANLQAGKYEATLADTERALTSQPDFVEALLCRAFALHALHRFEDALTSFDGVLALQPDHDEALNNRAVVLRALRRHDEALSSYERVLMLRPGNADAAYNRGNLLRDLRRREDALASYDRALASRPDFVDAHYNRANLLRELQRPGEALASYDRALELKPDLVEALSNRGNALNDLRRYGEALSSFDRVLALKADHAGALCSRGNALRELQRFDEALASYDRALAAQPDYVEAFSNRGITLHEMKRFDEALASYDGALALRPDHASALNNRGNVLHELKRFDEALTSYDRALAVRSNHVGALCNRGATLHELRRFEEALASYDSALAVRPDHAGALYNRGNTLRQLKRFDEALASYDRALALRPDHVEALNNRATALQHLNRFAEAVAGYDRVLARRPDYVEAHNNRGNALGQLNRHDEALASYAKALALRPDHATAHLNEALARLVCGDFERGWRAYEWRWKTPAISPPPRNFSQPLWKGDADLAGKTVLLHAEQGLGDTIQFCRYVPMVAARGARVVLEVQPPLKSLLKSLTGVQQAIARGEPLSQFDCHCPLLSLPLAFDTRLETVPAAVPYLAALPERLALWAAKLGPKAAPRVGVAWAGRATNWNDRNRSSGLAPLLALAIPGVTLVSLQKQLRAPDRELLAAQPDIRRVGEEFADFADTAAVIAQLDLVISVDTAVAHLAGAMGKPVFILLPYAPDWRWLLKRSDSPWYPTARLFRQTGPGDWNTLIAEVRAALAGQLGF